MEFNLIGLLFKLINLGLLIAIVIGIVTGVKKFRCFVKETKEMSKKLDCILKKLEK
ncbi:hypothetical protein [Clostridium tarantellae]|uniref:hypothetical protein n=1 Tax=Clostridium tarantellae TaxID=39493 RepID=UPI001478AA95|nr:hypothetical protein [Clostridium tarantellae]